MIMKPLQPFLAAVLLSSVTLAMTTHAGIIYSSLPSGGNIPDGKPTGWSTTATASGYLPTISDVTVPLNISGGYNGDLYAYLSYGGVLVPLLNRVGTGTGSPSNPTYYFGFSTSGYGNITLDDSATANGSIHNVASPVSGQSYQPDGGTLASFDGLNPNGTWTIFFADLSTGGGQSQVTSWSLNITAVPEPVSTALAIFGGVAVCVVAARSRPVRERVKRWHAAANRWIDAV